MNTISQSNRYFPNELKTRYHAIILHRDRGGSTVSFVW